MHLACGPCSLSTIWEGTYGFLALCRNNSTKVFSYPVTMDQRECEHSVRFCCRSSLRLTFLLDLRSLLDKLSRVTCYRSQGSYFKLQQQRMSICKRGFVSPSRPHPTPKSIHDPPFNVKSYICETEVRTRSLCLLLLFLVIPTLFPTIMRQPLVSGNGMPCYERIHHVSMMLLNPRYSLTFESSQSRLCQCFCTSSVQP